MVILAGLALAFVRKDLAPSWTSPHEALRPVVSHVCQRSRAATGGPQFLILAMQSLSLFLISLWASPRPSYGDPLSSDRAGHRRGSRGEPEGRGVPVVTQKVNLRAIQARSGYRVGRVGDRQLDTQGV